MFRRIKHLGALFALCAGCASSFASGGETWVIGGRTYEEVRVASSNAGTVTILHRAGISQLALEVLPPDLQSRFGFDPEKQAAWKREAEEELAATAEAQRRTTAERIARARTQTAPPPAHATSKPAASGSPIEVQLEEEVDLRPLYAHHGLYFKSQGRRPSCAVFAAVSAIEFELARHVGLPGPLSEEFVIWAARELQPGIPIDDGYHFQEVLAAIQTYGIPTQQIMPNTFGIPLDEIRPTGEALLDASMRRLVVPVWYRRDDPGLLARIAYALNHDTPVVVGMRWPHWRTLQNNNLLRDQKPLNGAGHAVTLIGYRCPDGNPENLVFLFRNSYGVDWGLGGCGFVAASYLKQNLLAAFHITIPDQVATASRRPTGD